MAIVAIVRNDLGEMVAAMAKVVSFIDDPTIAKAMASWGAVNMCVGKGLRLMVLEGDFLIAIFTLRQNTPC
jgi:hypothetical protein